MAAAHRQSLSQNQQNPGQESAGPNPSEQGQSQQPQRPNPSSQTQSQQAHCQASNQSQQSGNQQGQSQIANQSQSKQQSQSQQSQGQQSQAKPSQQSQLTVDVQPEVKGVAWLAGEIKRARAKPDRENDSQTPLGTGRVLISRRASEIRPEAIDWLWHQRIAQGKLSLIAGPPGLGKSQVTTYMVAIVSSGGTWSTGEKCEPGDVLILSAEDDPSDTIRPRLEACGADLDRIHIIEAVHVKNAKRDRPFNLKQDLEVLDEKLLASPDVKLVIIDPISAYLGEVNSHNNAEVRSVLAPLAKVAVDHGVAVVCVTHLNKGLSTDPLARVIDSTAFGAAVRTAFLIAADNGNSDRRFFLPLKSNISRACPGLAFQIEAHALSSGIETSRVVWENGTVTITAEEALSSLTPDDDIDSAKELAEACLRVFDKENAIGKRDRAALVQFDQVTDAV